MRGLQTSHAGAMMLGLLLGVGLTVHAQTADLHVFADGDTLTADQLNANFAAVRDGLQARGPAGSQGTSGVFRGLTAPTNAAFQGPGGTVGLRASKVLCEGAIGTSTAHMCSNEEMMRSVALGVTIPADQSLWTVNDDAADRCLMYTSNGGTGTTYGGGWYNGISNTSPRCEEQAAIACCD